MKPVLLLNLGEFEIVGEKEDDIQLVFAQIQRQVSRKGGKTRYEDVRRAIGTQMDDVDFKSIVEFLCNIGVICDRQSWPGTTIRHCYPGCTDVKALAITINKKNRYLIEGRLVDR